MSRLIDADKLKKEIENYFIDKITKHKYNVDCVDCNAELQEILASQEMCDIDEQPTAYDVDKVVEQLEEERKLSYADFDKYVEDVSPCLDAEYDDSFQRGLERAIKIIKRQIINNG